VKWRAEPHAVERVAHRWRVDRAVDQRLQAFRERTRPALREGKPVNNVKQHAGLLSTSSVSRLLYVA
jgi:hypothetical protein